MINYGSSVEPGLRANLEKSEMHFEGVAENVQDNLL